MLDDQIIRNALAGVGRRLNLDRDVDILIVGGAAGVLIGALPASWTTADVDLLHCHLPADRDAVLDAAAEVADELNLPPAWMNDFGGLYAWSLPDDWQRRRVEVGLFGYLRVYAISRIDLLTMKFLAHRDVDAEHLSLLEPTPDDLVLVRAALDVIEARSPENRDRIQMARAIVDDWT